MYTVKVTIPWIGAVYYYKADTIPAARVLIELLKENPQCTAELLTH